MRTRPTTAGPFSERPHYSQQEIENTCMSELRAAGCFPAAPEPIRVDRFLAKRFHITEQYEELDEGILGFTRFGSDGPTHVVVSRSLDEEGTTIANRRIRTTIAHEIGHILFQGHLFALGGATASLFPSSPDVTPKKILCREFRTSDRHPKYDGRWWEVQANLAMAALLLPRVLVATALEDFLVKDGSMGATTLDPGRRVEAETLLSRVFDVNPVVARLRLAQLWPVAAEKQLRL